MTPRCGVIGWGGALPTKGGIVVDFSRKRKVLEVNKEKSTVLAEPGVIWKNWEYELNKQGLASRIYPSSAPSATVAGWLAEGDVGYEYGQVGDNIESVELITAEGEVKTLQGDELEIVTEAEGITGLITMVEVETRQMEEDIPVVASFPSLKHLFQALREVGQNSLPLWHINFSNATFVAKKVAAETAAE